MIVNDPIIIIISLPDKNIPIKTFIMQSFSENHHAKIHLKRFQTNCNPGSLDYYGQCSV